MPRKFLLLASTALTGAGLIAGTAGAAEVRPLGALDIDIGGFARWYAFAGDLKEKTQTQSGSYDFRTDTEVFIYVRGEDEATGLSYGANIELEADTNTTADADEAFVFIGGNFGEFRLGDDDGISEQSKVGASTFAAFAGGLDSVGPFDYPALVYGLYSDDATKIIYYSPVMSGFQLGVSFTPHLDSNGTDIGVTDDGGIDDFLEGGISYTGEFGDFGALAAVTGGIGHFNSDTGGESDDAQQLYGGLNLTFGAFKVGGGYGWQKGARPVSSAIATDDSYIGDSVFEPGARQTWYNVGAGATFGATNLSVNWGQVLTSSVGGGSPGSKDPEPMAAVGSVDVAVAPGLVVGGELAWFENNDGGDNNDGVLGLAGVRLAF